MVPQHGQIARRRTHAEHAPFARCLEDDPAHVLPDFRTRDPEQPLHVDDVLRDRWIMPAARAMAGKLASEADIETVRLLARKSAAKFHEAA